MLSLNNSGTAGEAVNRASISRACVVSARLIDACNSNSPRAGQHVAGVQELLGHAAHRGKHLMRQLAAGRAHGTLQVVQAGG